MGGYEVTRSAAPEQSHASESSEPSEPFERCEYQNCTNRAFWEAWFHLSPSFVKLRVCGEHVNLGIAGQAKSKNNPSQTDKD